MTQYSYKVIPAPRRGEKARGVKTTPDRFALAVTQMMNRMAAEGWEYLRADTLPCDERVGLTGSKTTFQALLVFRKPAEEQPETPETVAAPALLLTTQAQAQGNAAPALGAAIAAPGAAPLLGPAPDRDLAAE